MPIQILQDDEKLIYTMAGSKIFYRRISTLKRGSIVRRHTKRGKTDWNVTTDILMVVILGWEAVQVKGGMFRLTPIWREAPRGRPVGSRAFRRRGRRRGQWGHGKN